MAVSGEQPNALVLALDDQPIAVMLDLMEPIRSPMEPVWRGSEGKARRRVFAWREDRKKQANCESVLDPQSQRELPHSRAMLGGPNFVKSQEPDISACVRCSWKRWTEKERSSGRGDTMHRDIDRLFWHCLGDALDRPSLRGSERKLRASSVVP